MLFVLFSGGTHTQIVLLNEHGQVVAEADVDLGTNQWVSMTN